MMMIVMALETSGGLQTHILSVALPLCETDLPYTVFHFITCFSSLKTDTNWRNVGNTNVRPSIYKRHCRAVYTYYVCGPCI